MTNPYDNDREDRLLAGLERLAAQLDNAQLPGRAWNGPRRANRRIFAVLGPAGALAAAIMLAVLLAHRDSAPRRPSTPGPMTSLPAAASREADSPGLPLRVPALLDAAVLAGLRLDVPEVASPPAVPGMASSPGLDECHWEIPEIRLPEL